MSQHAYLPESVTQSKLAETLSALANAEGGTVWVGVDGRNGQPRGLVDGDATLDRALKAALSTDPPLIIPMPSLTELEGKPVLVVNIPPGLPHVYGLQGRYLIREGRSNRPLSPPELRRLIMERGAVSFESLVPDGASLVDIDWEKAERYWKAVGGLVLADREELLVRRGCLTDVEGELRPTHAGLLLFGREPQRWIRSSAVLVARYGGVDMADGFVKEEIAGTLPEQIRRAEAFVVSNIRRGVRLLGFERVEETEYPVAVMREAIVNAVAHRDYQIGGDEIRVLLFSDRMEVYSPGRLPGHVTIQNLVDERFSRNGIVVQVLSDLGFIERLGYGVDRMVRLMAQAGLPKPRFEETAAGFRVTLVGHGAALISDAADARRWRHLGLNRRQEAALAYLAEKERITNREYLELCPDVSSETIRRDLADLVQRNLLLKIGDKRATYYIFK